MIHEALNPRGQLAKSAEMGLRRAVWTSRLCEVWLQIQQDDPYLARQGLPHKMPKGHPLAKDLAKAIRESKLWEVVEKGRPPYIKTLGWPLIFDQWYSGALQRSIEASMGNLPEENRKRVEKELDAR